MNEVTAFDKIENNYCNIDRKPTFISKQATSKQDMVESDQCEIAESIKNPYAEINLNSNISSSKTKNQQQPQLPSKRSNIPNQYFNNNENNFVFNNSNNLNSNNNNIDMNRTSNSNNMKNGNVQSILPTFDFINSNNFNQGNSQNVNKNNNFDFGLSDFTNSNNLQQNYNNMNNALNYYQNNQYTINSLGQKSINMNNNLNNFGISTGIPTTNFKYPSYSEIQNKSSQKNDDIFKDFLK